MLLLFIVQSCPTLFSTSWTLAHQVLCPWDFSRQEHWSGLPFHPPGDLPEPGIKPLSPELAGGLFTTGKWFLYQESPDIPCNYFIDLMSLQRVLFFFLLMILKRPSIKREKWDGNEKNIFKIKKKWGWSCPTTYKIVLWNYITKIIWHLQITKKRSVKQYRISLNISNIRT